MFNMKKIFRYLDPFVILFIGVLMLIGVSACQSPRISIVVDNGSTLTVGDVDVRAPKSIEATTDVDIPLVP